jgi:uncharacterized SAM-binding protein YcdF (DUF218 family)
MSVTMLLQPSNLLLLLLIAAAVAALIGFWRTTRWLLVTAVAGLLLITFLPLGQWLTAAIETRFPPVAELPEQVDGVVALTGGIDGSLVFDDSQLALNDAAERLTSLIELGRRYPDARLIHAGALGASPLPAEAARAFAERLGFPVERIAFETGSADPAASLQQAHARAKPQPGERWLLVTSAYNMPRAIGISRQLGWEVTAFPVDYRSPPPSLAGMVEVATQPSLSQRFKEVDLAAREWLGLALYRMAGRTSALLPSP